MLFSILIAVMIVLGIVLVVLILLQQGKGADAGAAFGSGASGTVFGARGSGSFLSRTTGVLMALFMILAVVMAWLGQHGAASKPSGLMASPAAASAPAPQALGAPPRVHTATRAKVGAGAPTTQAPPKATSGGGS
ncbi:MAG: preprotein translocase subunit SecG [Gammaproteobacteria bacterium]